ncbi:hypothetical protein WR25_17385 [Diploscapter pachys]|uniref:Wbp11/ELF5/Saf1 N-terminal domain-containing protein n=1 Tax=Diploscapter pachys TaxID=2018661 RepID=A0A2A2JE34_9BILA|nr:hypothetical protein WR25_17385 [Diploscapter pachys]
MGSATKTKSGKTFRAPTDQARKLERKRENKKNKKDRQQIRQAIAKHYNVDECTTKMLQLERQVVGLDPPQFHVDVLKKKQKTLMEMVNRRRSALQASKDEDDIRKLNDKLQRYHSDCKKLAQLAEQEKLAREADVDTIPLPMGQVEMGDKRMMQLMGPVPIAPGMQPVKKKVDFKLPRQRGKLKPPGPPCGPPIELSDSEGEDELENPDDDDLAPVPIPDFDAPSQSSSAERLSFTPMPTSMRRVPPPPPGSMPPPMPLRYNPMGLPPDMPPGGGFHPMRGGPMISSGAVIASAPVIRRQFADSGRGSGGGAPSSGPAVVTAEPQLRNLRQETVKLVPAVLKRKPPTQTVRKPAVPIRKPQANQGTDQAKSTDDAYNDFMKEISDLM